MTHTFIVALRTNEEKRDASFSHLTLMDIKATKEKMDRQGYLRKLRGQPYFINYPCLNGDKTFWKTVRLYDQQQRDSFCWGLPGLFMRMHRPQFCQLKSGHCQLYYNTALKNLGFLDGAHFDVRAQRQILFCHQHFHGAFRGCRYVKKKKLTDDILFTALKRAHGYSHGLSHE